MAGNTRRLLVIGAVVVAAFLILPPIVRQLSGGLRITHKVENGVVTPMNDTTVAGLSSAEQEAIKQGTLSLLSQKQIGYSFARSEMRPCTNFYDLGEPRILDVALGGTSGKVRVEVPITAARPQIIGQGQRHFPVDQCYGAPPGGWREGETSPGRYELTIEKWSTGWRLSQQQNLIAGG